MGFEKGNEFWRSRKKHGRMKLLSTPDALWSKACEYFEWVEANPWYKTKSKEGKVTETEETALPRPYSLEGFRLYIGASSVWWFKFRERCVRQNEIDFIEEIERIEQIIQTQQFEGACVGAFNANIIARKLGIADKQEVDHTNAGNEFKGFNFLLCTPATDKTDNL